MLTHSGEKRFSCTQCEYSCKRASHLKQHIRTHSGEKPFKCDQCDYSCAHSGDLKVHKRTHTGEQPYTCNQCSFSSKTSGNLQQHMARKHRDQPNVWEKQQEHVLVLLFFSFQGEKPKGPAFLKGLAKNLWETGTQDVLINSKADNRPPANCDWWKYRFMHCTMCFLYSMFSFQPNKVRHILKSMSWYIVQHIFVSACSFGRKTWFSKKQWFSNSKFGISGSFWQIF